jgi:hypothetical protein
LKKIGASLLVMGALTGLAPAQTSGGGKKVELSILFGATAGFKF